MAAPHDPALESLLAFWRDSGVADAFDDAPQNRLTESERHARQTAALSAPLLARPPGLLAPNTAGGAAAAREAALAADSLEALSAAIAGFTGSSLSAGARGAVFARGSVQPALVVIGEAPGPDDDNRREPFAGPSGRLLDKALAAAGLLDRALITNTVFWRTPGDRSTTAEEQAVCAPFLDRLLTLTRPRVLLLLGAASTKSVLKQEGGILSLRGRWFEHVSDDGALRTPALPTLHPGFLLRQPPAKKMFWQDLLALAARLEGELAEAP